MAAMCEAVALRTGERCKNLAGKDGSCGIGAHRKQLEEQRARLAAPAVNYEDRDVPAELSQEELYGAELKLMMRELPKRDESVVDEIAAAIGKRATNGAGGTGDLGDFERAMRRNLGELPFEDDPAAVDQVAAEELEQLEARDDVRSALSSGAVAGRFKAERVKWWLKVIVNPKLTAAGKDVLTDDELEEGAALAAEWIEWAFGEWAVESRTGRTVLWAGTVFGLRYWEELLTAAGMLGRWAVRRVKGMPAEPRPSRPVDQPTAEREAERPPERKQTVDGIAFAGAGFSNFARS